MGFVVRAVKSVVRAVVGIASKVVGAVLGLVGLKPKSPKNTTNNRLNKTLEPEAHRKIVFGKTAFGNDLRFWEVHGPRANLYSEVIALASHRVHSVGAIYFEDSLGLNAAGVPQGTYNGAVTRSVRRGLYNQTALACGSGSQWTAQATFDHVAHMVLAWVPDEKKLPNGIPSRYTTEGEGCPVYDPRRDSTVGGSGAHRMADNTTWDYGALDSNGQPIGRNNALQVLTYLLGYSVPVKNAGGGLTGELKLLWGRGVDPNDINLATFIAAANNAEAAQFYTDCILSTEDAHTTNEDKLTANGLIGQLIDPGGLWAYFVNVDDTAAVAVTLTDDDILAGSAVNWNEFKPMAEQFTEVSGSYIDPSPQALYQRRPYPLVNDDTYAANLGVRRRKTLDFEVVQDAILAQKVARLWLNSGQYQGEFSASFGYRALRAQVWSIVRLQSERFGWDKLFRVMRQDVSTTSGCAMVLREIHASIWTAGSVTQPVAPSVGNRYNPTQQIAATEVTSARVTTTGTDGTIVDGLRVVWDTPPLNVRRTELRYKVATDTFWLTSSALANDITSFLLSPLLSNTVYHVEIRHISIHEIPGPWVVPTGQLATGTDGNLTAPDIADAGTRANWSGVADDNGNRPDDNATVGAPSGTPVGSRTADGVNALIDTNTANIANLQATYGNTVSSAVYAAAAEAARNAAQAAQAIAEFARNQAQDAYTAADTARIASQTAATNSGNSATASAGSASAALTSQAAAANSASAASLANLQAIATAQQTNPTTFENGSLFFAGDNGTTNGFNQGEFVTDATYGAVFQNTTAASSYGVVAWRARKPNTPAKKWRVRALVRLLTGNPVSIGVRIEYFNKPLNDNTARLIEQYWDSAPITSSTPVWIERDFAVGFTEPFVAPKIVLWGGSQSAGARQQLIAIELIDITESYNAELQATAANASAATAAAQATAAGNSASAANQAKIDAQAANTTAQTAATNANNSAVAADASRAASVAASNLAATFQNDAKRHAFETYPSTFERDGAYFGGFDDENGATPEAIYPSIAYVNTANGRVMRFGVNSAQGSYTHVGTRKKALMTAIGGRRFRLTAKARLNAPPPSGQNVYIVTALYGLAANYAIVYGGHVTDLNLSPVGTSGQYAVVPANGNVVTAGVEFTAALSPSPDGNGNTAAYFFPSMYFVEQNGGLVGQPELISLKFEDITEEYAATSQASIATSQAAIATAQAAEAAANAILSASITPNSRNKDPNFALWLNPNNLREWSLWEAGAEAYRVASPTTGQYAARIDAPAGVNAGQSQQITFAPGWYVTEVEVTLVSGTFRSSGVHTHSYSGPVGNLGAATGDYSVHHLWLKLGDGIVGRTYRVTWLRQWTVDCQSAMHYAMSNWSGFDAALPTEANIIWSYCGIRPATEAEIATQTTLPALQATVATQAASIATLNTRTASWLTRVAAGTATATVQLVAEDLNGNAASEITLAANAVAIKNPVGGALVDVARFQNGQAVINNALLRGARVFPTVASQIAHSIEMRPLMFLAKDDDVVQYQNGNSYGSGSVPSRIEVDASSLPSLAAGESYDIGAISVNDTSFTAKVKKITGGSQTNQSSGAGSNVGGTPQWQVNKPTVANAFNNIYQFTVSGVAVVSYQEFEPGPGNVLWSASYEAQITIYVATSPGNWVVAGSITTSYSRSGTASNNSTAQAAVNASANFTATQAVTITTAIGQHGGNEFGVHPAQGTITAFSNVQYVTQSAGSITSVTTLLPWKVYPPVS